MTDALSPAEPPQQPVGSPPVRDVNDWLPARVWIFLAFGGPFLLFFLTTCRTLYVGDAGDFAVACWDFGIAHPPGYPLYTLLGALFARLPIPGGETEVAWRLNLMSALFGALTCGFVYLLLERVGKVRPLALLAAFAVAVSRAFWWQASITEVYTLNTFFMALQWWIAAAYIESGKRSHWHWLLIVMSLSLAHHQSILMFFPFIFGWIWWERRRLFPGTGAEQVEGIPYKPNYTLEWSQALILLLLPMITFYMYLPAVDVRTPVTEHRQLYNDGVEEFEYIVKEIILRNVYTKKAQFPNPTTSAQVADYYLKYLIGDPARQYDAFESGDQGTLALGILLALWAVALWRPRVRDDLPSELRTAAPLARLQRLTWLCLGSMVLFIVVVCTVPSGDILNAPQTNLRVVMPPLLIPGHFYLLLATFAGAMAVWHHLPGYVWSMREKDPMAPVAKLKLSRQLLLVALAALVVINGYNNWPVGDRSRSFLSWSYVNNVVKSVDPDSFVLNTGDETFLYWYLERIHWELHPEERPEKVVFTNWIHQIPDYDVLENRTEAELQRDIIAYFMKQQLVERAARALGATSNTAHPINLATTFFRPEFMRVQFFQYWRVELDGLVYKWEPIPEYEPLAIQSVIQSNATADPRDQLDPSALGILQEYLQRLLYESSPRFAAQMNAFEGHDSATGGATARAAADQLGPIAEQPDGTWRGPEPAPLGMDDPNFVSIAGADRQVLYQMPLPEGLTLELTDRDWFSFYDWRGVFRLSEGPAGLQVDQETIAFDAQEEEILARFQDLFVQHGLEHYQESTQIDDELQRLAAEGGPGAESPAFDALREQHLQTLLEADRWLSYAVKIPFVHNPQLSTTSWGLMGDIKLNLGQLDQAEAAYGYLVQKLWPADFPIEASRARANLALVRNAKGQRDEALQLVREALVLDPNNSLATELQAAFTSGGNVVPRETVPPPGSGFAIPPQSANPPNASPETEGSE